MQKKLSAKAGTGCFTVCAVFLNGLAFEHPCGSAGLAEAKSFFAQSARIALCRFQVRAAKAWRKPSFFLSFRFVFSIGR